MEHPFGQGFCARVHEGNMSLTQGRPEDLRLFTFSVEM